MIIDKIEDFCLKILEKIGLKKIADYYKNHQEGMRYLVFGALTTIVNIAIFILFSKMFNLSTTISNIIAWSIAVLFSYITNKICVFKAKKDIFKELFFEIVYFFLARVFTLVLETIILVIFIDKFHFNSFIMKIISNIIVIIVNFILSKILIFKKK